MANTILFYYFGDDEAYFKTLHGEFKQHTRLNLEFKRIYESDEAKIQALLLTIYRERPQVVFIDFSKQTQDYLHLARLTMRMPLEHSLMTVGLVDYLSPTEVISESNATGVNLTHIKGPETFDVVFDVAKILFPEEIGEHGFATAGLREDWEAGMPGKVGSLDSQKMHIETNWEAQVGEKLELHHFWMGNKIVPSRIFTVTETSSKNLFYHFSGGLDLEFLYVDEVKVFDESETERIKERKEEREERVVHHRKQLKKWLGENLTRSEEKKGKVLVVDQELKFYQDQPRSDKHPFWIRTVPYLTDPAGELSRLAPQVIAFSFEKKGTLDPKNNQESLLALAAVLKKESLNPFVVVFNCETGSKEMQAALGYGQVMTTASELSVELLVRMAEVFDKKLTSHKMVSNTVPERVFLRKSNPASFCEVILPIKVLKLSETDILFQSEKPLKAGTNLHLTRPVDMYVNVRPTKEQGLYHGLIHCLGENEKKELRHFVNTVFFREHDAALLAETEEFKNLNKAKLREKLMSLADEGQGIAETAPTADEKKE